MEEKEVSLADYVKIFYMHRYLVLLILVICVSFGFLLYKYEVPNYSSTATLVVDKETLDMAYTVKGVQRVDELVGSAKGYYSMRQVVQNLNLTQYPIKLTLMERLTSKDKKPVKYLDENELTHYYISKTHIRSIDSRMTNFIKITVDSQYPELSSAIANEIGQLIVERSEKAKNTIIERSIRYIEQQMDAIEENMQANRRQLEELEISSEFRDTETINERLERNKGFLSSYLVEKEHLSAELSVLNESSDDKDSEETESKKNRLSVINSRIEELEEQIEEDEKSLRDIDKTAFYRFKDMEYKASTTERIYSNLLSEKQKLTLGIVKIPDRVRFLSRAATPVSPNNTNGISYVAFALVAGLGISFGILQLLNAFHEGFKSNKDIEETLKLKVLGNIASLGRKNKEKLVDPEKDESSFVEPYETLATNLKFAIRGKNIKSIMFSSDKAKTGKSTTITNLASVLAYSGKKTIILDVDLRRPNLHKRFNSPRKPGLTEVLSGKAKLKETILKVKDNLYLLPAGSLDYNPQNIIESKGMKELIKLFEKFYDFVLIDSIPLTTYSDVELLAALTDASVLILDEKRSYKVSMLDSKEKLDYVNSKILGIVVNRSELPSYNRYYHYEKDEE